MRELGGALALVAAIGAVLGAFALLRRRQLLADTPSSPCAGVFIGWNEARGQATCTTPVTSHFTGLPCVYTEYSVEEERRSTHVVSQTDAQGNTSTHNETVYSWRTIAEDARDVGRFQLVDDSGAVTVALDGANLRPTCSVARTLGSRALFGGNGPTGRTRETEHVVVVGEQVFVCGDAVLDPGSWTPVICGGEGGPFVIATGDEAEDHVRHRYSMFGGALVLLGLAVGGAAGAVLVADDGPQRATAWIPGLALIAIVVLAASAVLAYNGLVRVRNRADRAWSLLEVMLQRRHDLIGQLVEVAHGYAEHERTLQAAFAALPTGTPADVAGAEAMAAAQTDVARRTFARAEALPALGADELFATVRVALADSEDRIAAAGGFYNDSVNTMNDKTHTWPGRLLARFGDFHDRPLFTGTFERSTEQVSIARPPRPAFDAS